MSSTEMSQCIESVAQDLWKIINMGGFSWEWLTESKPEKAQEIRLKSREIIERARLMPAPAVDSDEGALSMDLSLKEALLRSGGF